MTVKKKSDLELERDYFNAKKRVVKKPAARKKNQSTKTRLYDIVAVNEKTGAKTYYGMEPMTHKEAMTVISKMTPHKARRLMVEQVTPKRAAPVRRKNPDLASHAVKDKVHRHAILSVNHAGKALAGAGNPINKQGKLSYAQGYIEGAKDAGAITLSEANQLFDALRAHMKV